MAVHMRTLKAGLLLALSMMPGAVMADQVDDAIGRELPSLTALYRDLHAHPELSLQEKATSAKLAALVRPLGFTVTEGVGGHGVVAVMKNGPGPVLLIRADMDALPVVEKTGLPFASTVRATTRDGVESGVMHACGHDTHMAAWVGTARTLAAMKALWSGTLVMILQPAEEIGLGATAMLGDGLFTRFPRPTTPSPSTTRRISRRARSPTPPAMHSPMSTASTWSCAGSAGMVPIRRPCATPSCWRAGS